MFENPRRLISFTSCWKKARLLAMLTHCARIGRREHPTELRKDLAAAVEAADIVAIITNHSKFDYNMIVDKAYFRCSQCHARYSQSWRESD